MGLQQTKPYSISQGYVSSKHTQHILSVIYYKSFKRPACQDVLLGLKVRTAGALQWKPRAEFSPVRDESGGVVSGMSALQRK